MRTVELLCSPELEEAVRAAWRRLAEAGLPSLARNAHPTNRPHLTLASVPPVAGGAGTGRTVRRAPNRPRASIGT